MSRTRCARSEMISLFSPVFHALLLVLIDLVEKLLHVDHDTIPQNGRAVLVNDAAG